MLNTLEFVHRTKKGSATEEATNPIAEFGSFQRAGGGIRAELSSSSFHACNSFHDSDDLGRLADTKNAFEGVADLFPRHVAEQLVKIPMTTNVNHQYVVRAVFTTTAFVRHVMTIHMSAFLPKSLGIHATPFFFSFTQVISV